MIFMERNSIVAEFFKRGHLLTDDAIRLLEEKGLEYALNKNLPLVIDASDVSQPYRIIKNITSKKTELSSDDFVRYYNSKYEKMKNIIISRVNKSFISLNKVGSARDEVHVIGIVKEIKEKDGKKLVEVEDPTASIPVIFDDADVELDDVVAVQAVAGGRVLFGKKIIYPDIPLRTPVTGNGKGCFVSDLCLDESPAQDAERLFEWFGQSDVPYLFIAGKIGNTVELEKYVDKHCYIKTVFVIAEGEIPSLPQHFKNSRIVSLSNPAMVEVGGLKILMAQRAGTATLRKRHLGTSLVMDDDQLTLDEVPDIVLSGNSDEPYITNYKSVTLVNSGSLLGTLRPVVIDFSTREFEEIRL